MGLTAAVSVGFVLLTSSLWTHVGSLLCYDGKDPMDLALVNCTECKFCGVAGSAPDFTPLSFSAVGQSELDWQEFLTDKVMSPGANGVYQVRSFCLLESYDFGKMPEIFAPDTREVLFRCFCDRNQCNEGASLQEFFRHITAGSLK